MGVPRRVPLILRPDDEDEDEDNERERWRADRRADTAGGSALDGRSRAHAGGARTVKAFEKRAVLSAVIAIQLLGTAGTITAATATNGGDIEVDVKVPREARLGSSVEFKCEWRLLGGDGLYSVKWYKDDHEFFRYVPDDDPRIQTFSQPGINLDKRSSSEKSIRLRSLELTSAGQYKCEVSTEAPSFATTYRAANLTVIALPERGPEISGLSSHYAVGENVTANCTAWPSVPEPNLRWTINGEPVPAERTILYPGERTPGVTGKRSPLVLGLRLEAEPRLFREAAGSMIIGIKCVAEVGSSTFEANRNVPMAYVNNQRLSAGEVPASGAPEVGPVWPFLPLLTVLLFTT